MRSRLRATRRGNRIFLEVERDQVEVSKAAQSTGFQFEALCTRKEREENVGHFTAVYHNLNKISILCVGEVDCKSGTTYLELKASAASLRYVIEKNNRKLIINYRFWPLEPETKRLYFINCACVTFWKTSKGVSGRDPLVNGTTGSGTGNVSGQIRE